MDDDEDDDDNKTNYLLRLTAMAEWIPLSISSWSSPCFNDLQSWTVCKTIWFIPCFWACCRNDDNPDSKLGCHGRDALARQAKPKSHCCVLLLICKANKASLCLMRVLPSDCAKSSKTFSWCWWWCWGGVGLSGLWAFQSEPVLPLLSAPVLPLLSYFRVDKPLLKMTDVASPLLPPKEW